MLDNLATTKIYDKFQRVISVEAREKYDINGKNYFVKRNINYKGKTKLKFVKKLKFEDMVGRYNQESQLIV